MTEMRNLSRRLVLGGAELLREARAGVREGFQELRDPNLRQRRELERELQLARRHGRWISESEQEDLQVQALQHSRERRKLLMLLVVAVLVPLFWPLVPVLAGLIWFPTTTRRLLFVLLLLGGFLILVLVTLLLVAALT
jgi:hypothetical protein